ncbi:uncharacterized protein [Maniola hyperantus]|uniref:uncharacterized protein isoform X2 n=1 Tax=Aphantopus hyperantus TaxID=2795564 RepID=UPI0037479F21
MPRKCCVPHCTVRYTEPGKLHCVPFTSGLRWKQWLKMCPFLLNYSRIELERTLICKKHFIREHIDYEKGRLRKNAIPLLHLTPLKPNKEASSGPKQLLEINPIQANEPANFKVVTTSSLSAQQGNTFKCPSVEDTNDGRQVKYLVCLKAEDTRGLPVDHSMYCLPFRADERPAACLSSPCVMCVTPSKELLSSDLTVVSIEAGQEPGAPVDHDMYRGSPLRGNIVEYLSEEHSQHNAGTLSPKVECNMRTQSVAEETVTICDAQQWSYIKEEDKLGGVGVASHTVAHTQVPSQLSEQNPDFKSTNTKHSLNEDLKTEPVQFLDPQSVPLDNSNLNDKAKHDTVYVLPDNIVVDNSACTHKRQSAIYLSPDVLNMLKSKTPLEKETIESINIMFSTLKEQYNVPFNRIPTEVSQVNRVTPANPSVKINIPKLNMQSSTMKATASVEQPAPKRTLETLVAELAESITAEETSELQAATPVRLPNPMSDTAPRPLMQSLPLTTQHLLTPNINQYPISEKRFRYTKENSSEKEQMLYTQLKKLRLKMISAERKIKLLKSKFKKFQERAKPYLKRYPRLTPEGKALIDSQLRLAGSKPQGARYTEEEKLFALKLHQISPDCYRFLQQYLKLPNKSTMQGFVKIA